MTELAGIEIGEELTSSGKIRFFLGRQQSLQRPVVVVQIESKLASRLKVMDELRWWQQLRSPALVEVIAATSSRRRVQVALDQAEAASIDQLRPTAAGVAAIACDVLEGLEAIHGTGRGHGWLSAETIYADPSGQAKLSLPVLLGFQRPGTKSGDGASTPTYVYDDLSDLARVITEMLASVTRPDHRWPVLLARVSIDADESRIRSAAEMRLAIEQLEEREEGGGGWRTAGRSSVAAAVAALGANLVRDNIGRLGASATTVVSQVTSITTKSVAVAVAASAVAVASVVVGVGMATGGGEPPKEAVAAATPTGTTTTTTVSAEVVPSDGDAPAVEPTATTVGVVTTVVDTTVVTEPELGVGHLSVTGGSYGAEYDLQLIPTAVLPGETVTLRYTVRGTMLVVSQIDGRPWSEADCDYNRFAPDWGYWTAYAPYLDYEGYPINENGEHPPFADATINYFSGLGLVEQDGPLATPAANDAIDFLPSLTGGGTVEESELALQSCLGTVDTDAGPATVIQVRGSVTSSDELTIASDAQASTYRLAAQPPSYPGYVGVWSDGTFPAVRILPTAQDPLTGTLDVDPTTTTATTTTVTTHTTDGALEPLVVGTIVIDVDTSS